MENGANGYAFSDKEAAPGSGAAGIGNAVFGGSYGLDDAMGRHPVDSGGAVVVRISHPFQHHCSNNSPLPFKSPGGGMATSAMGFPFTWAQWKELERQAMVYKYMMASVPVPPDLLLSISSNTYPASNTAPVQRGGKNRDLEPGRCKRTDGKKWRCAKEVAPNQKYCERHLHRGRPRSRKPVEDHQHHHHSAAVNTAKKNRSVQPPPQLPIQSADAPSSSNLIVGSQPLSLDDAKLEHKLSISHFKEPNRSFDWMMMEGEMVAMGGAEEQWQQLMETRTSTRLAFDTSSPLYRRRDEIGFFQFDCNDHHPHNNGSYYDASMAAAVAVASIGDDSAVRCNGSWKSGVPLWAPFESGGPLGEVLKPSNHHQIEGEYSISQAGTSSVSSPSGVLQPKAATPFSHSDGSVCNSPTALPPAHSSSDMLPFQWLR